MNRRTQIRVAIAALALAPALLITSCSRTERWCELDRGDVVVANFYCENQVPGYEWEPDHDHPKMKRKPVKTTGTSTARTTR